MSLCSHVMLEWQEKLQKYRCTDCPSVFYAERLDRYEARKSKVRVLPITIVVAVFVFALAALAVFGFKSNGSGGGNPLAVCDDNSKIEKRARDAEQALLICENRPPEIETVEIPSVCPKTEPIVIEKPSECPKPLPVEEKKCPATFKTSYQQCMSKLGSKKFELRRKTAKIAELRALLSKRVRNQSTCGNQTVHVPNRSCKGEIESACGHLRGALNFCWGRRRKMDTTTAPDTDGLSPWQGEPFDEDDPDKDVKEPDDLEEWDDEIEMEENDE